jgi:3-oxoacyl-[acyl-carrier-protein] synthase III
MGVVFKHLKSHCEFGNNNLNGSGQQKVLKLASTVVDQLESKIDSTQLKHLVLATTCPDSLAPSVGQTLVENYHHLFSNTHVIDIVQGCAGGVSALILGSQLAEVLQSTTLVIQCDAARKATSPNSDLYTIFGNGSFACLVEYSPEEKGLLHYKSKQYKDLVDVVTVKLGHDADAVIAANEFAINDPRLHLGLTMNKVKALKLLKNAEGFYQEFIAESQPPEVMILHQANPDIVRALKSVFSSYPVQFIDMNGATGNCGTASTGIALHHLAEQVKGKKTMLCSYGTGGVITAGLWQM